MSDGVFVVSTGQGTVPLIVPLDADGGQELFNELCKRGLLPEAVQSLVANETDGGIHCWPPQ